MKIGNSDFKAATFDMEFVGRNTLRKTPMFRYNLQIFAKDDGGEKTEDATSKKLNEARKGGQVAKSQELIMASGLLALFLVIKNFIGFIGKSLLETFTSSYRRIDTLVNEEFNTVIASTLLQEIGVKIITICLPVFISGVFVAVVVNIFQVKWKPTAQPLHPKFSKINPMGGFKKIISVDKLMDLLKSVIKILIITYIVYDTLKGEIGYLAVLYEIGNLEAAIVLIGNIVIDLGLDISTLFLVIGLADLFYQKRKFKKDMKMSKQEVKDEYKQTEGDPKIKGRIRQKMREVSHRRMMQKLPEADVIITNPTHFACALKYDKQKSEAPILIAKGADYIAGKIKEVAKENKIPIVENKPLARMLYYNVDLDTEIPQELYQMVAEVLAYVYSLRNQTS